MFYLIREQASMYSAFEDISTIPTGIWKGSVATFITESQSNSGGWPN